MPYLNWRNQDIPHAIRHPEVGSDPSAPATIDLQFSHDDVSVLIPQLEQIFLHGGHELRMDLPDAWTVFWKSRSGESRLLLAHPQLGEWVGTVALEVERGKDLLSQLKNLLDGKIQTIILEEEGRMNNLILTVSLK